ncbi:MAG: EF-hand domain-containing protein [Myxococcota bacterium]
MTGPTLRGIFNRVDVNRDGALDKAEVKKFVEDAKVGEGMFAGKKVSGAVDAFMDTFDTDKNGKVGWDEFAAKGQNLIPGAAKDATPADVVRAADDLVTKADANHDGAVVKDELKDMIEPQLEAAGVSMSGTKADIAAKIGVHALDDNGDGKITRDETRSLATDVAKQLQLARGRV